ncbi:MAG: peptide chain release factor H [Planctomycetota bacterium]
MRQWIQITSGRGPAECAWAVTQVLARFTEEATAAGFEVEMLESVEGPFLQTLDSALISISGDGQEVFLASWLGTILWISRSPFRPTYKRKNWFVGISSLSLPERFSWSESELRYDTMRASGPGGQHVNKTETAVRVTHLPTGLTATAREERSQSANKKLALARLAEHVAQRETASAQRVQRQRWAQHETLERGKPVRVYVGERFELKT